MQDTQGSFTVSYPLGIEDVRVKRLMHYFTRAMFNGFAHYQKIEKVIITWEHVYIFTEDDVKEYALRGEGLDYIRSHDKKEIETRVKK